MIVSENINDCPKYQFVNYYNTKCAEVRIAVKDSELIIMNDSEKTTEFFIVHCNACTECRGRSYVFGRGNRLRRNICTFEKRQ